MARLATAGLAIVLLAGAAGCAKPTAKLCAAAHDHLAELSHRRPDPDLRKRFVDACVDAWDEARHACLMAAETPEEALRCELGRPRPG